ncbi:MAG: FG-GAP repeat domain-containing protein [Candidatus Brocadiia bacterium]
MAPQLAAAACLLAASQAPALISPHFTPVHLVEQSEGILVLRLGPAESKKRIPVAAGRALKGKKPAQAPTLDLSRTAEPHVQALLRALEGQEPRLALLFYGRYREEGPDEEPEEGGGSDGLLHVRGLWFRLGAREPGVWMVDVVDERLQSCWAGSTDMLLRVADYVLTDPDPWVPVRTLASWAGKTQVANVAGAVGGVRAVDLAGDGRLCLHVLSAAGDRLFRWDGTQQGFAELAGKLGLGAASRAAAWGDFNADSRLDLASWDGAALRLWLQAADGTFQARDSRIPLKEGCIGLAALDVGAEGRAGLLVSTAQAPIVVWPREDGSFQKQANPAAPGGEALGEARPCLVADFDGDRVADLLQPFAQDTLFYKGKAPGRFAPPRRCGVATGPGPAEGFVGDFDADGLLDVFVGAEQRCFVWQNRGGSFEEALGYSGEAAYISKPQAIGGSTGDVNNDGRQDVLILYAARCPQIFFNRGFRSFGHSHALDLAEQQLLPPAAEGQQAGLLADLDGDGGQDMALVLAGGETWVFFREVQRGPALCLRVALAPGGYAGPLTVTGWSGPRCLGAWNVAPGVAEAFFGQFDPGPVRVRWQLPGGEPQEKQIIVESDPVRFVIRP